MILTRVSSPFLHVSQPDGGSDCFSYLQIYHKIAIRLTNYENPRTHTEYEDSYTFKIFFFEFMNFYSSLIYIAFFKGRFYDYPGDDVARKSDFYRLKGEDLVEIEKCGRIWIRFLVWLAV